MNSSNVSEILSHFPLSIPAYVEVLTNQKGRGKPSMSLQGINQRDSEDIFDSWIESRWLWTSGMIYGSSVKNVRTLGSFSYEDPELPSRSLGGNSWYLIEVLMTLVVRNYIYKYQGSSVQNFRPIGALEEDILIWVSRASSKESWRIFLIPEWIIDDYGRQEWHV